MENIWFIADTHFNHQSILKHCNRPFANIDEMNEKIIENWNSMINRNDRVYIIGDFAFSNHLQFIDKLRGKKHLIKGNHDEMSQECYSRFESVSQIKEVIINKRMFVLCHFPLRTWSECHNGSIHLFGHCHGRESTNNLSFDIGIDTNNYKPYSYDEVMNMINKREEEMKRVHRIILNKDNKKHPLQYFQDDVQYFQFIYKKASEKK